MSLGQSLLVHAENSGFPRQTVIYTSKGSNDRVDLLLDSSPYELKQSRMPPDVDLTERIGLSILGQRLQLSACRGRSIPGIRPKHESYFRPSVMHLTC